jgi:MoaA/NifB/PqqE/SkfB family radical SAM enzyme
VRRSFSDGRLYVPDIDQALREKSLNRNDPKADSQNAAFDLHFYTTGQYPHRDERKVFFAVSSGLCNLSCPYCITDRPRFKEHLTKDDFSFIFDYFGENIYLGFSGLGDFFCGYSKEDQLLRFLLQHDVMVFLDINGVQIHELGDPDLENKERVGKINVSYHYGTMRKQKLISQWVDSVQKIQENKYNYDLKMVCSPREKDIVKEALLFYRNDVQPITGQKLIVVPDGQVDLKGQMQALERIADIYGDVVVFSGRDAMYRERLLPPAEALPCPAGSRYFRILNNGDIMPCELFGMHMNIRLGNAKKREMIVFRKDVYCNYTGFCDCFSAANPEAGLLDKKGKPYRQRAL